MASVIPLWQRVKEQSFMDRSKYAAKEALVGLPRRLYQALPAVLLGVLFNTLDAGMYSLTLEESV